MAKKVQVIVDVNSSSVQVASDNTLTLTQQVRELKKALQTVPEGTKEWTLIQQKYNETKDALDRVNVKSKELFGTMSSLPGPIGQVSGQLDNTVGVLKTFSAIKLSDIKTQFVALGADLKEVGKNFLDLTGITKLYDFTVKGLTKGMVALGLAEEGAAVAARGLSGALIATGIGALVVAVGYLIANFDDLKEAVFGASAETKAYNEVNQEAVKTSGDLIVNETALIEKIKKGGLTRQEQIKVLNDWNEKHKETNLLFTDYAKLENYLIQNGDKYIAYIMAKAKADANYAVIIAKQKELLASTATDPAEFRKWYDYFSDQAIFGKIGDLDQYRKEVALVRIQKQIDILGKQTDGLNAAAATAMAEAKVISTEVIKPLETDKPKPAGKKVETPEEKAARLKKEALAVQAELDKVADDAYAKSLSDKDRELYEAGKRYNDLLQKAKQYNLDTTALREAYEQEQININSKYDEAKATKDKEKAAKDAEAKFKADQEAYSYQYEQNKKLIDLEQQRADAVVLQNQIITQSWIDLGNNISSILGSLAQTFQGNETLQKIFAVTQVAVNTASAIGAILLSGQSQQAEYNKAIAAGNASIALAATTAFIPGAQALAAAQFAAGKTALAAGIAGKAKAKISTTAQVAVASIAGAAQIAAILSAKKGSGASASSGGGQSPTPAFNGTVSVPAPVIGASQASNSGNLGQTIAGAVQAGNSTSRPIQAYVVGDQVSTQQQLDRRISVAAKMGG